MRRSALRPLAIAEGKKERPATAGSDDGLPGAAQRTRAMNHALLLTLSPFVGEGGSRRAKAKSEPGEGAFQDQPSPKRVSDWQQRSPLPLASRF